MAGMAVFLVPLRTTRWTRVSDEHRCWWPPCFRVVLTNSSTEVPREYFLCSTTKCATNPSSCATLATGQRCIRQQYRQLGSYRNACGCAVTSSLSTRIIHQPQKSTRESAFEVRIARRATASPDHPDPKTSPSGCPGSVQIGRTVAIGHTASSQPA
jgi:hypothetical protein